MLKKIGLVVALFFIGSAAFPSFAKADFAPLVLTKQVRNITQGSTLAANANATPGDELEFEVAVQNASTAALPLVTLSDVALSSLQFEPNIYVSRAYAGQLGTPGIQVASVETGGTVVLRYRAVLSPTVSVNSTLCSVSNAAMAGASTSATSCVYVQAKPAGASAQGLVRQSVTVVNDTKNTSGPSVSAQKEDFLTYTFTATNAGTVSSPNYAMMINISGISPLVDVVDLGGGVLSGSTVSYAGSDILPGASLTHTMRVRVKYYVPPYGFRLSVQYGNEAVVTIPHATGLANGYVAPNTGKTREVPTAVLAGLVLASAAFVLTQRRLRTVVFK